MKTKILAYLMQHYGVTENHGIELIAKYHKEVADAERWASEAYYPAGKIAEAEKIQHLEPCPICETERS